MKITINANLGKIYDGEISINKLTIDKPILVTEKVKLKLILENPELSENNE